MAAPGGNDESPVMAKKRSSGHAVGMIALPPASDFRNPMSSSAPVWSEVPSGPDVPGGVAVRPEVVESGCGAVAVGSAYLFPPLSSGGASIAGPLLRFHTPLIEPDVRY